MTSLGLENYFDQTDFNLIYFMLGVENVLYIYMYVLCRGYIQFLLYIVMNQFKF